MSFHLLSILLVGSSGAVAICGVLVSVLPSVNIWCLGMYLGVSPHPHSVKTSITDIIILYADGPFCMFVLVITVNFCANIKKARLIFLFLPLEVIFVEQQWQENRYSISIPRR